MTATLLIATTNPGKVREIREILADLPITLSTLADLPPIAPPEETERSFAANARLKAEYYARASGRLTVAEDSGLEVEALGGRPGVESARFGGEDADYPTKFALLFEAGAAGSIARFVCALALVREGKVLFEARGTIEGVIADQPSGTGGFGYDPIFYYPPFGSTLAAAGARKSEVSHRAAAFRQLRTFLAGSGL